jgi:hypothetical protein
VEVSLALFSVETTTTTTTTTIIITASSELSIQHHPSRIGKNMGYRKDNRIINNI